MSNINYQLWDKIPGYLNGVMDYYPDVFLYEFNQIQYTRLWQRLAAAKYIYSDGCEIRPTNWWMYAFQSIKGWFGFQNHCQPEIVSYSLNKLAYYGYSQRLSQPDFSLMRRYSLSSEICGLVSREYEDANTARLQKELIKAFFKVEPYLNLEYNFQKLNPNHRFGESWLRVNAGELIPRLDPQDKSLILELVDSLDKKGTPEGELLFLKGSKYAQIAAQYYCDKAKKTPLPSFLASFLWQDPRPSYLAQALAYNPHIAQNDPGLFIEYHLQKREYQSAINLLGFLDDSTLILKFLLLIPEAIRDSLIEVNSPLAAQLAKHYLERKQYSSAERLYTNIEELSPVAAFSIALREKNHFKAYELFKRHERSVSFPVAECKALSAIFFDAAETEYEKGVSCRAKKLWSEAEPHYFRSLVQKKAAQQLHHSSENLENVYIHQRLYAQLLVDTDLDLNKPESSDFVKIHKAITLLRECKSNDKNEQHYQKLTLANALMRRVDTLREKISFTYTPADHSLIQAHKDKHQQEIAALIKTLEEIIALLNGTKDKNLLLLLGKAYYLLADVHSFFDINEPNINQYYRKAMLAVPDNPFYILRVSELFDLERDKLQNIGVPKLKNMGFDTFDYLHWSNERWVKADEVIHNIKDIHSSPPSWKETPSSSWSFRF